MSFSPYRTHTMCKRCRGGSSEGMECKEGEAEAKEAEESRKNEEALYEGEVHDAL